MDAFEKVANTTLVETFNYILKYEDKMLRTAAGFHVTVSEAHFIEAIYNLGGSPSISEVANTLEITLPSATAAVKKLEKKGFIVKTPCKVDGRKSIISLTETGQRVDKAHRIFHRKMVRNISNGFLEEEKEVLISALTKLNTFFKDRVED